MDFVTVSSELFQGFLVTLKIFFVTLAVSIPLGIVLSIFSLSKFKPLKMLTRLIILVFRGTPLMLQVIAVYYGPAILFGWKVFPRMVAVLVAFIINYACYFAEIFRGGIESVPKGQYEAGVVLGLTKSQIFFRVILLQMIKRILPSMSNEVISLVKDTSIARVIVVSEILKVAGDFTAKGIIWPLFYTGAYYLAFIGILSVVFGLLEKKLNYFKV